VLASERSCRLLRPQSPHSLLYLRTQTHPRANINLTRWVARDGREARAHDNPGERPVGCATKAHHRLPVVVPSPLGLAVGACRAAPQAPVRNSLLLLLLLSFL
jgi:hypothetical protein